ncbi:PDZ domain-containing protein [Paenibacillus antri]|uniref:PDZ domain-containing protein n=1 Tax=Paenibacillus antri TaxID=2582848 RepID=A0A5R9G2N4_9BACL|nr:S41 family peptidase [Paenibacillus antri]TLS50607.1 PDZ domain-containing protein [Paenibacillus antri]
MMFKGRTVLAFVLLAVFASSIVTLTVAGPLDHRVVASLSQAITVSEEGSPEEREGGLSEDELSKLSAVYKLLEQRYVEAVDRDALTEGALDGLVQALEDPYSEYLNAEEVASFSEHINSTFTGIGAEVALQDGKIVVVSPIKNSPAERAGLMAGDVILSVNGESLQGLDLTKAVEKIRGPKGTQAKLQIQRKDSASVMDIIVVRDDISLETVEGSMLEDGIGLIGIRQFAVNTGERFAEELKKLEDQGMKGLVIDVRNNPGGVVQAVQSIAEAFVPEGKTIMHLEYRDGKREKTTSKGKGKNYPIVVLINEGSASASEILGAAIQESAGGKLVGQTTFGKGLVQSTVKLNDGSGVKLTIAKWLTPDGDTIHETGIKPDIVVEQPKLFEAVAIPKDKELTFDMAGDEVKNVQLILDGLGFSPGRTDGYFSESTKAAVVAFQKDNDLPENGTVDEATALKLEERVIQRYLDPANDEQMHAALVQIQKMLKK